MNVDTESSQGYSLSSQQCAVHVDDWQARAPLHVVLVEGPASAAGGEVLRQTLDRMIEHHEILRTCYRGIAGLRYPMQYVQAGRVSAWQVFETFVDDESLMQAARSLVSLRDGPVIGSTLTTRPDGRVHWAVAVPAYSLDGTALQELIAACVNASVAHGRDEASPEGVIQYLDYAAWQSEFRASEIGDEGGRFWEKHAANAQRISPLPFESDSTSTDAQTASESLTDGAEAAVAELAGRLNAPTETVMRALWACFMARVMQTDTLSFDWHADGRAEEIQGALGCFSTKLPVSLTFADELSMDALLRSLAAQLQATAAWQECFDAAGYEDHLARLNTTRSGVEFVYLRVHELCAGWQLQRIELDPGHARLKCIFLDAGSKRSLRWQTTAKLLPGTLQMWIHQFMTLLESAGRHPDERWTHLAMIGNIERQRILAGSRPRRPAALEDQQKSTLHGLFDVQARRMPDAIAVVCGEQRLTYQDLNSRAHALACRLRLDGIGVEQRVGIYMGRSAEVIVAMLAVLKSGAAYVPLDPAYPAQRIDDMVADAGITIIVSMARDRERFMNSRMQQIFVDEPCDESNIVALEQNAGPDQIAYVIYTSGSTGRPKGVMASHANAVASTLARFRFYQRPVERFLLLSSPSFDSSVAGIYWTLAQGGSLYIPTDGMHQDTGHIAELIAREKISHLLALPSFYRQILDSQLDAGSLCCAIVAGEACRNDVVELHRQRATTAMLVNEYGPTEGTVWSNAFRIEAGVTDGLRVPIGRPIDSMHGYVLDDRLELCPMGLSGEWYIGGDGIARGYAGQPGLTAQRFVADPFGSGERLYRTGDRVRLRPDGEVDYLGRTDGQIKLRGHRIELDEIEAALLRHELVKEAAVIVDDEDDLKSRLLGFFVMARERGEAGSELLHEALLSHLRRALPAFMIPAQLIAVSALPLMPNGKVDRQALLALRHQGLRPPYVPPSDETARVLADIWQGVLKVERVGMQDNFFDLGGHSLSAAQVTSRIRHALAVELPLKQVFDSGTLAELADRVRHLIDASGDEIDAMETVMAGEG